MGNWRADQSKGGRRYQWGQSRGKEDPTLRDFLARSKKFPEYAELRSEKIGTEIHCWREMKESHTGKVYWTSCLRFADDGWGYWTVHFRPDEARWRSTPLKDLPIGRAVEGAAEFYRQKLHELTK